MRPWQYWAGWVAMGVAYMTLDTLLKAAAFVAVARYLGWTKG